VSAGTHDSSLLELLEFALPGSLAFFRGESRMPQDVETPQKCLHRGVNFSFSSYLCLYKNSLNVNICNYLMTPVLCLKDFLKVFVGRLTGDASTKISTKSKWFQDTYNGAIRKEQTNLKNLVLLYF